MMNWSQTIHIKALLAFLPWICVLFCIALRQLFLYFLHSIIAIAFPLHHRFIIIARFYGNLWPIWTHALLHIILVLLSMFWVRILFFCYISLLVLLLFICIVFIHPIYVLLLLLLIFIKLPFCNPFLTLLFVIFYIIFFSLFLGLGIICVRLFQSSLYLPSIIIFVVKIAFSLPLRFCILVHIFFFDIFLLLCNAIFLLESE